MLGLLSDHLVFWTFQFVYVFIAFYCFFSDCHLFRKKNNLDVELKRGKLSWSYFVFFYGISATLMLELINTTQAAIGYKTVITCLNMALLIYLCFYNSRSRNWIIGFISKAKEKVEK